MEWLLLSLKSIIPFPGFNRSPWHAFWIVCPLWLMFFLYTRSTLAQGYHYFFDPKHNTDARLKDAGDFEPHSKRYQEITKLAITLSAAAIAFLINTIAKENTPKAPFMYQIEAVAPIVVGFFGASIACLIAFMLCQAMHYEQYCHAPKHNTYKRWKYALNVSLAETGLASFILGFGWLAHNLFKA